MQFYWIIAGCRAQAERVPERACARLPMHTHSNRRLIRRLPRRFHPSSDMAL